MGRVSPLYLIGDAASRRGLSRVGYFITLNGPLNGHPPSTILYNNCRNGSCFNVAGYLIRGEAQMAYN